MTKTLSESSGAKRSLSARERRQMDKLAAARRRAARESKADQERMRQIRQPPAPTVRAKIDPPERLMRGARKQIVHADDGSSPEVMVRPGALRRLGLITKHQYAAERFLRDWETASYTGLRCRGFEPGVDGSKGHAAYLIQCEAQNSLRRARATMGDRNFDIVEGVLIHGANTNIVHSKGGRQNRIVSNDIEIAFNSLAAFYSPGSQRMDPNWKAFRKIIEEGNPFFVEASRQLKKEGG
jgi:hypothetical protein